MNTLPEHLIDKIMLYVSHPCADLINNSIILRVKYYTDTHKCLNTPYINVRETIDEFEYTDIESSNTSSIDEFEDSDIESMTSKEVIFNK